METGKQLSVPLENKPGRLANVLSALAREKVNITALSVMESHDQRVLRVVLNDVTKSKAVLKSLNTPCTEQEVVVVEMRNHPGALAHVCELLAAEHINIDYCYCSAGTKNGKTLGIFKVPNPDKAMKVLATVGTIAKGRRIEGRPVRNQGSYQSRNNSVSR